MRDGSETSELNQAELVLVHWVRKLATDPQGTAPDDVQTLRAEGWGTEAILEATSIACLSGFTNTLAMSLHFEEDLERLAMEGYF